jgi:hypothetical protein
MALLCHHGFLSCVPGALSNKANATILGGLLLRALIQALTKKMQIA